MRRVNRDVHLRVRPIYDTGLDDIDEMLHQSNVCRFFRSLNFQRIVNQTTLHRAH